LLFSKKFYENTYSICEICGHSCSVNGSLKIHVASVHEQT
jgi:hypothetical protein